MSVWWGVGGGGGGGPAAREGGGGGGGAGAGGATAACRGQRRAQRRARTPTATSATRAPPSGSAQASRLNPLTGGAASTPSPNSATSFALISPFVSPAAIRSRMKARIRSAIGERESASVV